MTRDELLASLLAERYDGRWWKPAETPVAHDDDLACARRRRALIADDDAHRSSLREAR